MASLWMLHDRRPRTNNVIYTILYSLTLLTLLGFVDSSVLEATIKTKKSLIEINVGKTASLEWSYNTGSEPYNAILWGKGNSKGTNFDVVYFSKTPNQGSPKKSSMLDTAIASRVKIVDGSTLVISDVKLSDEGFYVCEIRAQFLNVVGKIYLKVYDPAKIIVHPPPLLEYNEGAQENIVCKAKGKPRPEVQWYKDGRLIAKRKGKLEINFNPVVDGDMARYKCLAHNKGGKSEIYTNITVFYKPKATVLRTDVSLNTVSEGSDVSFMCKARGYPKPQYKFSIRYKGKGETPLTYKEGERTGKFKVTVMDKSFHGTYICIPYNRLGDGPRQELVLYVRYPPTIIRPPRDITVEENNFVATQCLADGYPQPTLTWVKLKGNVIKSYGTSFNIPSVTRSDQGEYQCIADNKFGKPAIGTFSINVLYPPIINRTASSLRVAAWEGYNATLKCVADGNPEPKYKWRNASGVIAESEVDGTLLIRPTDNTAFGDYTCQATNSRGMDSHTVTLIKVEKPGPIKVAILVKTKKSIMFQWTVTGNGQSPITYFTIKWKKQGAVIWEGIQTLEAYASDYDVKNLDPFTVYTIQVLASNKYFTSDPVEFIGKTVEAEPTKPYDVIGYPVNKSAVRIEWKEPKRKNAKNLIGYTVFYCRIQDCVNLVNKMPRVSVAHNYTWTIISGLQAFTNYSVKVRALNIAGTANSDPIMVTTKMAAPSAPEQFSANSSAFSVTLTWKKPRLVNGHVLKFRIRFRWRLRDLSVYKDEVIEVPAAVTTLARVRRKRRYAPNPLTVRVVRLSPTRVIRVSGLRPYSMYILSIAEGTGSPGAGILWGPYGSQELLSLPEAAPSPPEKLQAFAIGLHTISVSWEKPSFPNGKIKQYALVYSNTSGVNYTIVVRKDIKNDAFKYKIAGLRPYTPYRITVRAYTNYPGPFSEPVFVTTGMKATGSDSAQRKPEVDSGSLFGGVFAGIILFAFVIIIVVLIVRNRRRKRDSAELKSNNRHGVANSNDSGIGEKESLDNVPGVKFMHAGRRGSEEMVGPGGFITMRPVPLNKLYEYCKLSHANVNKLFREEFLTIRPAVRSSEISLRDENRPKNRYQNIVAYDHTRVVLSEIEGDSTSDYINANFVDGYNSPKKFICTQGPVSNTFNDFWRMVCEHSCTTIVMVTNIIERGKIKCLKYWPSTSAEEYGTIIVTPTEEEELSHYVIRKFTVAVNDNEEQPARNVTQYHYTAWPDHGVPSHATSLLAFIRRVRASVGPDPGPIVVHCSAGVGRTGTYVVLDAMMDQMASECVVDPYGFVNHIRQQRNLMVQTEAQYIFLYDALLEATKCGTTEFKVQELHDKVKHLLSPDPTTGEPVIAEEFKNLDIGDTDSDTFDAASLLENKSKNRHAILPFDRTRVKLWPYAGVIGSDYINASFIDSYQQREAFLATQAPLQSTIGELFRMLWEYESYTVVMLNQDTENDKGQSYLPNKGEFVVYGLLMVEIESREDKDGYSKRVLKVTNTKSGEIRKIFHFQFYNWEENSIPEDGKMLIDMLKHIARAQQQTGNGPLTVHCSDGSGRTGTFCAISIALERVKLDGTIDMFQTVRHLRTQRPLMVQTEEQYKFCYEVVRLFVDAYSDYANFK